VGDKRILTGVGNGTYYLKAGQLGACDVTSAKFTIDASSNGLNDSQKVIIDAYCNKSNGSISKITVANNLTRIWYNVLNQEMGRSDDLMNVPAGGYYFTAGQGNCLITSPTYVVKNVNEVYQLKSSNITLATCGSSNGRVDISGEVSNASFSFKWFDEQNIEVSNSEDLINAAPGRYRVVAYSANGCSNEVGQFTVPEAKPPVINTDAMQKFLSCDGKLVSTTGLSIDGSTSPYAIKWTDEDGNIVSDQLNLKGIPVGKYQLQVIDKYGCINGTAPIDFTLIKSTALSFANSITPNGDGINDFWEIKGFQSYPDGDFSVYSRDGNRIFHSRGYSKTFNGLYNGKALPTGVYYYVIDLKTDCGTMSGSLTILR
ncbi:MAG: gliding motility-associated C-terminal domain-containing protein, partial [Pedobacter sp.]